MSIKKKAGLFFIGRVVYSLSMWMMIVFMAKISTIESLDAYMLAIAIAGPIIMFFQMNMRGYLVTDYENEFNLVDYIVSRKYLSLIAFLLIIVIGVYSVESNAGIVLIFLVGCFKIIESMIDIYCGVYQRDSSMKFVAYSNIARGVTALVSVFLMLVIFDSVALGLALTGVFWLIIYYVHKIYANKNINMGVLKPDFSRQRVLIKKCLPLGFVMMLVSLNFNVPIYLLNYLFNGEGVGVYSSIAYLLLIGKVISESFVQASAPKISEYISKKEYGSLKKLSYKLLQVAFLLGGLGIIFSVVLGEIFLSVLYGDNFSAHNDVFLLIMLAAFFSYISQIYGMILTAWRSIKQLFIMHTVQIIVVISTGFVVIPSMGLVGAALSLVAGYFVIMCLNISVCYFNLSRLQKEK